MKRIVIVRHAKSEPYGYDDDFNRDLTERGISDAGRLSSRLKALGIFPDLIISSEAVRALHTATIFAENLNYSTGSIRRNEALYHGITTQEFIEMLQNLPDSMNTVFVFGHNPTVYYLVYNLVKYFNSDMPTCSTVVLDFEVETWKEVAARGARLEIQLTPKSL